jgi:rhodanese-related sulfurtransferase
VDKRIDVCAAALHGRFTVEDLTEIDLAYAPPYSSANDPLNMAAFVAMNDILGVSPVLTADEAAAALGGGNAVILDVRTYGEYTKGHVKGTLHIPVDELRDRLSEVPREKSILVCSKAGFEGHIALRVLRKYGFGGAKNITGGYMSMELGGGFDIEQDE